MKSRPNLYSCCIQAFFFMALTSWSFALQAQSMQKYWIGNSGCSVNLPAEQADTEFSLDADGNKVYITKATQLQNGVEYQFYIAVLQLHDEDADANEKLQEFADYIKSTQLIADAAGYRKINNLVRGKMAKGISDTWTDQNGTEYQVTGWAKGRTLALMYVAGEKPYPSSAQLNGFFNSFQFPSAF
ncbi:MAG TPA: hypothetical protein VLL95_02995 [Phnomibacter sp.]|nr:hypothetical protein [Phnomibacter sp.]